MYDLIQKLDDFLNCERGNILSRLKLKFYKTTSNHTDGDFKCPLPSFIKREELTSEFFDDLIAKHGLWTKTIIQFEIKQNSISLYLDRELIYMNCLRSIFELGPNYGHNDLFKDQVIKLKIDPSGKENLTGFRVKLVSKCMKNVLEVSGCGVMVSLEGETEKNIDQLIEGCGEQNNSGKQITSFGFSSKPFHSSDKNVCIGHVVGNNGKISTVPVNQYLRQRTEEVVTMCEGKSDCQEEGFKENSGTKLEDAMLDIVVSFDLLHTSIYRNVVLSLDETTSDTSSCKGAVFVLYNYVRVVAICDKFDCLVSNGSCPPLPSIDEIDFSLLSDNDEWKILYDYILNWPQVVKRVLHDFDKGKPKLHMIVSFLSGLASDFSQYYRRRRILTELRSHLLPVLFARIYLLKGLREVLINALSILSIKPPSRM